MIYLYFDKTSLTLYAYTHLHNLGKIEASAYSAKWTDIETVTQDAERNQILAHGKPGVGIVTEFPKGATVLTCQKPEN